MTTSNTITCRNCGHQSHPEIFCQYRATSNQTLHRDRHLTCGKYGHKEFAFGDKCEACVRNLRHRIRAGARERAEEGLLIDVSVPDENGVGGGESAAEGVDPLVGMMGGNLLNGEGNTQGPRFGNGTGAGEGILVSVGVPDGNEAEEDGTVWMMAATSLNGQGNTQSLRSPIVIGAGEGTEEGFLIDISIPDGNGVGDGESHTKNVEEDANAGLMNGTSLNEIRRENVVEADENGANEGWNRDREGVLIDVGVPDWEITEEEEDALVEMSGESTLNGNGLGNVSEGEGEGSDGWNGEVLIEF
jgi:hypothetical protein